jgi:uncharacterized SAM-binding protein YcdF (DUF218 family)
MNEVLFVGKKLASLVLYPVGAVLVLCVVGLIIIRNRPRIGRFLIGIGILILIVTASPLTSHILLKPLQEWAGPYADAEELSRKGIVFIVVLGGGVKDDNLTPADGVAGVLRVMEGVRLVRRIPGSKLVLLQPGFPQVYTSKERMAELPTELGVSRESLVLGTGAKDTSEEAALVKEIVADEPFALVTSAYHMYRAMETFRRAGLKPMPAPCEFVSTRLPSYIEWFMLSSESLVACQVAIHEYVGLVWIRAKDGLRR